jgi:NAD+ kinase
MKVSVISPQPILVLAHPMRPASYPIAERIAASLAAEGVDARAFTRWDVGAVEGAIPGCRMVIAIGGDGAMLRAARVCAPHQVPVLGINMGQLGFLNEIRSPDDWPSVIGDVLAGNYWVERRMMLNVTIVRAGETLCSADALNDVVISGDVIGKMIALDTYIDKHWTTTYYADALVIATATGSTAYALACGGPILPPELKNILIVPAAPHLSMDRPIVLSEGSQVEARPASTNRTHILAAADGIPLCALEADDRVLIRASDHSSAFIRLRGRNYFYRSLLDRLEPRVRRADYEPPEPLSDSDTAV